MALGGHPQGSAPHLLIYQGTLKGEQLSDVKHTVSTLNMTENQGLWEQSKGHGEPTGNVFWFSLVHRQGSASHLTTPKGI